MLNSPPDERGGMVMDVATQAPEQKFELSHAVTLFTQEVTTINSLWTTYVVATFAAAGYGLSANLGVFQALAVTVGFLTFAIGNAILLWQASSIARAAGHDIRSTIARASSGGFDASLRAVGATANPPRKQLIFHIIIDVCVLIALWSRVPAVANFLGSLL
jgi:hypothetical protein